MTNLPKSRILIVEDEIETAQFFQRILAGLGETRIAAREHEVLTQIIDFKPQLILLDIHLKGETEHDPWEAGVGILEDIRKLTSPVREIPVVMITALIDVDVERRCKQLGIAAFILKPAKNDELREVVQNALRYVEIDRAKLLINLKQCFSISELKSLCFKLGMDHEELSASNKNDMARELVEFLERRGRLHELLDICEQERPNVPWQT